MKSQKLIKTLALVLVLIMSASVLVACGGDDTKGSDTANSNGVNNGNGGKPTSTAPLVVAYSQFSQKFSPFFATTAYDTDVAGMTQIGAMTTTRSSAIVYNGIEGETENYNGTDYQYHGIADLKVEQTGSEATSDLRTIYTIKIRDDLKFSDGQPASIDDIIFYYYVVIDPYYTGNSTLGTVDIVGLEEYMYDNSNINNFDAAAYVNEIDSKPLLQQFVMDKIVTPTLTDELDWVKNDVMPNLAGYNLPTDSTVQSAFYKFYGLDDSYDPNAHSEADVLAKLIQEYGFGEGAMKLNLSDGTQVGNFKALSAKYGADFSAKVEKQAKILGGQEFLGEKVPNVEGIKKLDQYTVQVTTEGYAANAIYQICSATLTPMHYYGDASLYNYDNNQFGFENRTEAGMTRVGSKDPVPMGAGPYKFVKYEDQVVYFEANPYYYLGEPIIKNIQFKETNETDKIAALATGDVDISPDISGSVKTFEEIAKYNKDTNAATGSVITSSEVWNLGYGYIGINADLVKVGQDGGSTESKNLRKAIATLLAVHRDTVIASYYDEAAAVIEYPISSTSWAAPQISDNGYQTAFSTDVNGIAIYTSDMNADQKVAAAKEAAKGFLTAAGYTWDAAQNKFTAAPTGAKMQYKITLPAGGQGDHPAFNIAKAAQTDLLELGLTLDINDVADANLLWNGLEAGTIDMWAAAWSSTIDPDMYQVYHSSSCDGAGSNHYDIKDERLDSLIVEARKSTDQTYRKTMYKECLNILMDWAVEVPAYQRKNLVCFSTERINLDTVTPDITTYWGWMNDIEKLELKK